MTIDEIRDLINKSIKRDKTGEDDNVKYLIELPLTNEEYKLLKDFLNKKIYDYPRIDRQIK